MITATFRGINLSQYLWINEITGRGVTPTSVGTIDLPGMVGVHAGAKKRLARVITIKYTTRTRTLQGLRNIIDTLSTLLDTDSPAPLEFSDEPGRVYYAILDGVPDSTEIRTISQGTLTFLCPDPFKYGATDRSAILKSSSPTRVPVSGTSPVEPVFSITALRSASSLSIVNQRGEVMSLGAPSTIGSPTFDAEELILHSEGNSMAGWVPASVSDVPNKIDGNFSLTTGADGDHKFYVDRFKSEPSTEYTSWHGPAIKNQLSVGAQDFIVDIVLEFPNGTDPGKVGNLEYLLADAGGNRIAHVMISDANDAAQSSRIAVNIGGTAVYNSDSRDRAGVWNNFVGRIRLERKGSDWNIYIAKMSSDGAEHTRSTTTYRGGNSAPLRQVILAAQAYGDMKTIASAVRDVKVYKLNDKPVETAIPNIFKAGDLITIDHRGRGSILINGRDARQYKQLSAIPFKLRPGDNTLTLLPSGSFNGSVKWREAYK